MVYLSTDYIQRIVASEPDDGEKIKLMFIAFIHNRDEKERLGISTKKMFSILPSDFQDLPKMEVPIEEIGKEYKRLQETSGRKFISRKYWNNNNLINYSFEELAFSLDHDSYDQRHIYKTLKKKGII